MDVARVQLSWLARVSECAGVRVAYIMHISAHYEHVW